MVVYLDQIQTRNGEGAFTERIPLAPLKVIGETVSNRTGQMCILHTRNGYGWCECNVNGTDTGCEVSDDYK